MLGFGLAAAPAQATLLARSGAAGLLVRDENGIGDDVSVSEGTVSGSTVYVVTNRNLFDIFKFDRQANCSPGPADNTSICRRLGGTVTMDMFNGDDKVRTVESGANKAVIDLGSGNDHYLGIDGPETVTTGDGDNVVDTRGGNDHVTLRIGTDSIKTGSGDDVVDKEPFFDTDEDTVDLGSGNDSLSMQSTGDGSHYTGGSGADSISLVSIGDDRVDGGSGNDTLTTGEGADKIDAGSGVDSVSSGPGGDDIVAKEATSPASADTVTCGSGGDFVAADLIDHVSAISDPGGGTCDEIERSPVGETPHVKFVLARLRVSAKTRRVGVRLACPRGVHALGCHGRLRLRIAHSRPGGIQARSAAVKYKIAAGKRKTVTLRMSRADVRTLRARRRAKKVTRGILVSVETGRKGRKTTVGNPRLSLR